MLKPVVLDTCALLYLFQEDCHISPDVMHRVDQASLILSVSFAEIACKSKLKKIDLGMKNIFDLIYAVEKVEGMEIINIDVMMWLAAIDMEWPEHRDPADRLIVSYAQQHGLSIVTSDQKIKAFYKECLL